MIESKKERIERQLMYLHRLEDRQSAAIPPKHMAHPEAYRQYIEHEIELVKTKLELLKLE